MSIHYELLIKKMQCLELENTIMSIIGRSNGFYAFYSSSLFKFKNKKEAFDYCNHYYKEMFGTYRYTDFEDFQKHHQINKVSSVVDNPLEILEREYLLSWFKNQGFNTFTSFKAVILHFYPVISESTLYEFWQSKSLDAETQKYVGYVKQIIGKI